VQLIYFDENKYSTDNPFFLVGGIVIREEIALSLDKILSQIQLNYFGTSALTKDSEFHGKEMFHGKGNWKGRPLSERVKAFQDISNIIISNKLPIRLVCIDVNAHRDKYSYPMPEYRLGLMLFLERSCGYLETINDIGLIFGDYEKDEITKSILDFSQFKFQGRTPWYYGRPLGRLIDTVYFTQSHHSRFLQVADIVVYMAGRYENGLNNKESWHETQVKSYWQNIKANVDFSIQHWP
jgi:hypothetical protein